METELLLALAAFAFVASITPGPNNIMLMASGTNFGFRRTIPHMLGVVLGMAMLLSVMGAGLYQLFDRIPLAYTALKWISVAYLLFLAWKIATAASPIRGDDLQAEGPRPFSFFQAALFQWVNPKAWTMGLAAIATYTSKNAPFASLAVLVAVFAIINVPSVSVWTLMGVQVRRVLSRPNWLRAFNITAALLLLASLYPVIFGAGIG